MTLRSLARIVCSDMGCFPYCPYRQDYRLFNALDCDVKFAGVLRDHMSSRDCEEDVGSANFLADHDSFEWVLTRYMKDVAFVGECDDRSVSQHAHIAHAAFDLREDRLIFNDSRAIEFESTHFLIDERSQQ